MVRRVAALVLLVLAVLLALAVPVEPDAPTSADVALHELDEAPLPLAPLEAAPQSIDELRAKIADVLAREQVPGAAIALVDRDGVIWSGGVGVRDLASRAPVDADTIFRVASITKGFVGLGVMRLVEQGRLELGRPLAELMPEVAIANRWHAQVPVTLAHALEHTAGFDDMRPNETFTDDDAMAPADALALNPRSRVVRWRPGSRFAYSNVGYGVAGRAIEIGSGEPFDVFLRREVLQPLGMHEADFRRTPALERRLAIGYGDATTPARFGPIAHRPAGALLASANDLAQLVRFWLRRGEGFPAIVSPAGLDRIEQTGTAEWTALATDYGLGNYGDVSHPVRMRGHDGGLPGFLSNLRYSPELGVGYVVLVNSTHSPRALQAIRRLAFAYLTRDRELPPMPAIPDGARAPEADFFAFTSPRHELFGFMQRVTTGWRLEVDGPRARIESLAGGTIPLVPTTDGGFRHPLESGTSIRVERGRDGCEVLVHHGAHAGASRWWFARARLWVLGATLRLLDLTPWISLALLFAGLVRKRMLVPVGLLVWPAVAALSFGLFPRLLGIAGAHELLGVVHPWTIAICASTLVFALASGAGLAAAVRCSVGDVRPSLWLRIVPSISACACFGLTLWLLAHGIIGLRTWAW